MFVYRVNHLSPKVTSSNIGSVNAVVNLLDSNMHRAWSVLRKQLSSEAVHPSSDALSDLLPPRSTLLCLHPPPMRRIRVSSDRQHVRRRMIEALSEPKPMRAPIF